MEANFGDEAGTGLGALASWTNMVLDICSTHTCIQITDLLAASFLPLSYLLLLLPPQGIPASAQSSAMCTFGSTVVSAGQLRTKGTFLGGWEKGREQETAEQKLHNQSGAV